MIVLFSIIVNTEELKGILEFYVDLIHDNKSPLCSRCIKKWYQNANIQFTSHLFPGFLTNMEATIFFLSKRWKQCRCIYKRCLTRHMFGYTFIKKIFLEKVDILDKLFY